MLEVKEKINDEYLIFSGNVKKYRLMKGITQEKLAEATDLSLSYIKQIESKKEFKNVTFTTLEKLSNALNVSIKELFMSK